MAKIDFKKCILKDLAGKPFEKANEVEGEPNLPVTIADVIQTNLLSEDKNATPTDRFNYYRLASRIKDAEGEVEFTLEELKLIKDKVGQNSMPLVVGRVWEVLDGLELKK
jgi:hypothetical protein